MSIETATSGATGAGPAARHASSKDKSVPAPTLTAEELTRHIKQVALDNRIVKVGIAARADLEGPPEADPDGLLPGATHAISMVVVEPEDHIFGYLSKTDPDPYRAQFHENIQTIGRAGLAVAAALEALGHRAKAVSPNGVYAKGSTLGALIPPFSHRYAAHAAGVGAIGLSGNVMTPEYGTRVYLGTVIADAPLLADGPLDEDPCDGCKLCVQACPTGFMSETETVTFTMGGREITHAKKRSHARCGLCCSGFTGLSRDGKWSTLAPSLFEVPEDDDEAEELFKTLMAPRLTHLFENPDKPNFMRLSEPVGGYEPDNMGILARNAHDTHTTCGNCAIVCFETKRQRARALKTLRSSGVVVGENADGMPIVMSADDARDYRAEHSPEWYPETGATG